MTAATAPRASAATSSSVARVQQVGRGAAELGRHPDRPVLGVAAGVQPGQQPGPAARVEDPAGLFLREPAVFAVDVHAVGADGGGVGAPGADRVDVVAAAAEELGRHHLGRVERHVHPGHAGLVLERAEHPHVGQLAVAGQVVAGLRLDRGGAGLEPRGQPLAHVVAERPRVGAPGHGDRGADAAARRGDLGVGQAGRAHRQLGVPVARVDRVRVRVDQPRGHQAAAQVLHQVHVDDVIDHAGDAARKLGRRPDPGDPVVGDQDGGVADELGAGPEPADACEQPGGHRGVTGLAPCPEPRGSVPAIMSATCHAIDVGADRAYQAMQERRDGPVGTGLRGPPHISVPLRYCTEGVRYKTLRQELRDLEATGGYTTRAAPIGAARDCVLVVVRA